MGTAIDRAAAALEAAEAKYQADIAGLKDGQGRQLYNDDEHAQRVGNAWITAHAAFRAAGDVAAAEAAEAADQIERADLEDRAFDPIGEMSDDRAARAASLAPFVREDFEALPADVLAHRVTRALDGYDPVRDALLLRYGLRYLERRAAEPRLGRAADGTPTPTGTPQDPAEERLAAALRKLRAQHDHSDLAQRRQAAQERADAAAGFSTRIALARYQWENRAIRPKAGVYKIG